MTPTGDNTPDAPKSSDQQPGSRSLVGPTLVTCVLLVMCVVPLAREPLQLDALTNWTFLAPFVPLPLALTALRGGGLHRMVIAGAVGAGCACLIVVDGAWSLRLATGAVAALNIAVPGMVMLEMREGGRWHKNGASAMHIGWLAIALTAVFIWLSVAGTSTVRSTTKQAATTSYDLMDESLRCDPDALEPNAMCQSIIDSRAQADTALSKWLFPTVGVFVGLAAWAWAATMLTVAWWWARRRGTPIGGSSQLRSIYVPWQWVYALAASVAAVLFVPTSSPAFLAVAAALAMLTMVFLVAGIAACVRVMHRLRFPLSIRVVIWAIVIASNSLGMIVLAGIGVIAAVRHTSPDEASA